MVLLSYCSISSLLSYPFPASPPQIQSGVLGYIVCSFIRAGHDRTWDAFWANNEHLRFLHVEERTNRSFVAVVCNATYGRLCWNFATFVIAMCQFVGNQGMSANSVLNGLSRNFAVCHGNLFVDKSKLHSFINWIITVFTVVFTADWTVRRVC